MGEPVRVGFLSTARINAKLADAARGTERVEVVAVASRDLARARRQADELGIERAYGSYEALLADPDVDAVYVSLPNALHVEWAIRAIEAGKHVLCEKPFDRSPDAVARAFDAAESAGLVLQEAFMYRHHPQTSRLLELVRGGTIGRLRLIRAAFSFPMGRSEDIRMQPELDGGALMDAGCYGVHTARLLAGEPERVFAEASLTERGVDVRFAATLRFPADAVALLDCGYFLPRRDELEVVGDEGSLFLDSPWICREPRIEVRRGDDLESVLEIERLDPYMLQLENMSDAVAGRAAPLLGRDDAVAQARVLEALHGSARRGAAVAIP